MKTIILRIICAFFVVGSSFGQTNEIQATFKKENPLRFLAENFYKNINSEGIEEGQVVISFTISKAGEVLDLYPEKFKTKNNALPAILAVQSTNNMWSPAILNGVATDKKYKIVFNLYDGKRPSNHNLIKADRFFKKEKYEKALKFYNKAIIENAYLAVLFQKRARVKMALNDEEGYRLDLNTSKELQNEVLLTLGLGVLKKERYIMDMVETIETKTVIRIKERY